jgi:sugar-specific transcriptional regulator TrmB
MVLDVLGLSRRESAAYRALVALPSAAPAELAGQVGGDEDEAAQLLGVLEGKGLAARSVGDTARFVASPPATAFGALLLQRQNELRLAELELGSLTELYRAASAGRGVAEVVDVIVGVSALRQRLEQLQLGARSEVMTFVNLQGARLLVPDLDLRRPRRGADLGVLRLGPRLGLGSERGLVAGDLGGLRGIPACPRDGRLARTPGCLGGDRRAVRGEVHATGVARRP